MASRTDSPECGRLDDRRLHGERERQHLHLVAIEPPELLGDGSVENGEEKENDKIVESSEKVEV